MSSLVVVTGHRGYIGSVLVPMLQQAGYAVRGIDVDWYRGCDFGRAPADLGDQDVVADVRDVERHHLQGATAVIHLAALSNDPVGALDPALTWDINHRGTLRVAEVAKAAGVRRFLFSSSCSLYGAAPDGADVDESVPSNAVTAYGETKIAAERDLSSCADGTFSPVYLRNATAYGSSPRLRGDLVVNEFVARALVENAIEIRSDGTPWRPLVHVADIGRAFLAALEADVAAVHNRAFNVGQTSQNFRVRDIAASVASQLPGSRVAIVGAPASDTRSYRVNFDRIERELTAWQPASGLLDGVRELKASYTAHGIAIADLLGPRYTRLKRLRALLDRGDLDGDLRWRVPALAGA